MSKCLHLLLLSTLVAVSAACADGTPTDEDGGPVVYEGPSVDDDERCDEDRTLCVDVLIPPSYEGTPRMMAVALYTFVPPIGPPDETLAELEDLELEAGHRYPVVIQPMLETGDWDVWINLYMEGGGEFIPANGIDMVGSSDGKVTLVAEGQILDPIELDFAGGF